MKNVLLLVHDDAGQESRFQAALDITRAIGGHLTCLDVAIYPMFVSDVYAVTVEAAIFEDEKARETDNREKLEARLAREDVPWTFVDALGNAAQCLEDHAALADVIVVSRKLDSEYLPDTLGTASQVAIGSDKLVVAVPEKARGFDAAGRAMVAWDGSEEASHALERSVPLLQLARTVTLVQIADGSAVKPAEEAATYLSRHGISAVIVRRRAKGQPTAEVLLAEAKGEQADYIVMGAFGRSRLVESILGGVSREMLSESPVPIVMAH
jgi:nucleotide-binding universal stress UspA family protein